MVSGSEVDGSKVGALPDSLVPMAGATSTLPATMRLAILVLVCAACSLPRSNSPTPPTRLRSEEVLDLVRDVPKDIKISRARSDVMIFEIGPRTARAKEPTAPCTDSLTEPAAIATIVPTPDFGELLASGADGSLLRRVERAWEPMLLSEGTPPIVALVGFVAGTSPLELVVGTGDGQSSELWTLTIAGTVVTHAAPTDMSGPEYLGPVEFLRAHDTPRCLDGDRTCLLAARLNSEQIVAKVRERWSTTAGADLGLIDDPRVSVTDISWSDAEGRTIYLAASGSPCLSFEPPKR